MQTSQIQTTVAPSNLEVLLKHIIVYRNDQNCSIQRENSMKVLRNNAHVEVVKDFLQVVDQRAKLEAFRKTLTEFKKKPLK